MKEDNSGPKIIKGDNSREVIICDGQVVIKGKHSAFNIPKCSNVLY